MQSISILLRNSPEAFLRKTIHGGFAALPANEYVLIFLFVTPYGKTAMAICFDGDFQSFIRQAGKNEANILFLPANDWREIAPYHTNMAIRRAIENGFSLVHPTGQGLSVAADNRGRIISTMDFYKTDKQIMYASVPFYTSPALYAQTGDVFAWLCISVFIGIIISVALFFGFSNSKNEQG